MTAVDVVVVSYNSRDQLRSCVEPLVQTSGAHVIVVDNASVDGSADSVAEHFPAVRLVRSERNLGFAGGTNRAACEARGRALLLLNPDAALTPGALGLLLGVLASHEHLKRVAQREVR